MIELLTGTCVFRHATGLILDVAGVGYGVEMAENALAKVQDGAHVSLWIFTHVREDAIRLFGFSSYEERLLFHALLDCNDVGPRLAMAIMGRLPLARLVTVVQNDDAVALEEVPGVGPRKSKKILLEIKPKLEKLLAAGAVRPVGAPTLRLEGMRPLTEGGLEPDLLRDLQSALENFGYKEKELQPLLRRYARRPPAQTLPELLRLALSEMTKTSRDNQVAEDLF